MTPAQFDELRPGDRVRVQTFDRAHGSVEYVGVYGVLVRFDDGAAITLPRLRARYIEREITGVDQAVR